MRITGTWADFPGATVDAAAAAGALSVTVDTTVDLDLADGETGWLVLAGGTSPFEYVAAEDDETTGVGTVTLAAGLPVALEVGDSLRLWDDEAGIETVNYKAQIADDDGGSFEAAFAEAPTVPLESLVGASVDVDDEDVIVRVWGRDALVDGATVAAGTLPSTAISDPENLGGGGPASDLLPPTSSPTPTLRGGIGSLFITWPAIVNPDPVTYDVHLSATSGFTPSTATLVGSLAGTGPVAVKTLTNGTALVAGTTYYAKIIARDVDGPGPVGAQASGVPVQVTSADIAANAVTADMLVANDALVGALNVVDLSTVNFNAVNIDGGAIQIAGASAGAVNEPFTGTTFPTGWSAVKVNSSSASVKATVVNSGAPAGVSGSAICVDFGPAGLSSSVDYGKITPPIPVSLNQEIRVRFRTAVDANESTQYTRATERVVLMVRSDATFKNSGGGGDAVVMDLIPSQPTPGARHWRIARSTDLLSTAFTGYIENVGNMYANPTTAWCWAALRINGGTLYAKVWEDGTDEPAWEVMAHDTLPAGQGTAYLAWTQDTLNNGTTSRGLQKVWIDQFYAESFKSGFQVNADGTGSWPGLLTDSGNVAATGDYTGSVRFLKMDRVVFASGNINRAVGTGSGFTPTGVVIPVGMRPLETMSLAAAPFYNPDATGSSVPTYRFRLNALTGDIEVQMNSANSQNMALFVNWSL